MWTKIKAIIASYITAGKAGQIVGNCKTGCELDNENEVVLSCIFHRSEISRLEAMNTTANERRS